MPSSKNSFGYTYLEIGNAQTVPFGKLGTDALGPNAQCGGRVGTPGAQDDLSGMPWKDRKRYLDDYLNQGGTILWADRL